VICGGEGPPGRERPGASHSTGPHQQSADTTTTDKPIICHGGVAQWFRRRRAAERLVPLDCGCRDPWPCRCSRPPVSEKTIDAGAQAARHLLDCGQVPLLEIDVLRALWRRGGTDRQLAQELYDLAGGVVA
jgi:hypothetical protein